MFMHIYVHTFYQCNNHEDKLVIVTTTLNTIKTRQCLFVCFLTDNMETHFLLPFPIVRNSSVTSGGSLDGAAFVAKEEDEGGNCVLWVVEGRPLFRTTLLDPFSAKSAEEVARTLDPATAFLEKLWFLDIVIGLSLLSWFNKTKKRVQQNYSLCLLTRTQNSFRFTNRVSRCKNVLWSSWPAKPLSLKASPRAISSVICLENTWESVLPSWIIIQRSVC